MTKALKRVAIGLAVIVGLNLIAWAAVGRASAFSEATGFFEESCPLLEIDTLHVFASVPSDEPGYSSAGDLSRRQRTRFLDAIKEAGGSDVVYHPVAGGLWPGTDDGVNFSVWVDRRIPLYAHVVAAETATGYAASYEQPFVWAFGWWPVGPSRGGCA